MKRRISMPGQQAMAFLLIVPFLLADDLSVFNEIQGTYDRAIRGIAYREDPRGPRCE